MKIAKDSKLSDQKKVKSFPPEASRRKKQVLAKGEKKAEPVTRQAVMAKADKTKAAKRKPRAAAIQKVSKLNLIKKKSSKPKAKEVSKRGKLKKKAAGIAIQPVTQVVELEAAKSVQPPILPSEPVVPSGSTEAVINKQVSAATILPQKPFSPEGEKEIPKFNELELEFPISVKELSVKLQIKPSRLIQELIRAGIFATINQSLSQDDAVRICEVFGVRAKSAPDKEEQLLRSYRQKDDAACLSPRPPVVTFMGHVDHGKTSLLDIIRKTDIVEGEHGGITQHIGAYEVVLPKGKITFLDTPGHESFTAMRSRGAHITDIVVLVVAADDGVMPQTIEAIDHARAAEAPIIVAINKIDRPQANVDQVKKQLDRLGLKPEDWEGKTITIGVSAKTGQGIDELLEMILLEAEMLELKANYSKPASGVVIESRHDRNRGPLVTLLVENGVMRLNDNLVSGLVSAKVKAMFNDFGQRSQEALPGTPVEVLGFTGLPEVGEEFFVTSDEKQMRELISLRKEKERQRQVQPAKRISLEDLHSEIKQGRIKELKIIIKADVAGSLEAVRDCLEKIETQEIKMQIIHAGIGPINASDAMLAKVTNALILGFHVQPDGRAKEIIEQEGIETRTYNIIYELIQEIKAALEGMLEPQINKIFLGRVDVRKVFRLSRSGVIAGCMVIKGKILRSATINLVRDNQVIFEGKIADLKRFKDDVREVAEGFECGISLAGFKDYREGDIIEAYEIQEIARKL